MDLDQKKKHTVAGWPIVSLATCPALTFSEMHCRCMMNQM